MANDQRERRREGSRRAQAARERRLEARARRNNRNLLYGVAGVAVVIVAIVAVVLLQGGGTALGYEVRTLPGSHNPPFEYVRDVEIDGELVAIPPTSGAHLSASPYGFVGDDLVVENVVHNMEHGAVVIWYQPGDEALATQVSDLVSQLGRQCLVAGVYESMSFPVAATVWGRVLPLHHFDGAKLREFVEKYRGAEGPEAGVCERE